MKFDFIVGNPPYQEQVGPKKTQAIWDKFVDKSLDILNIEGYMTMVHPSGWRNASGKFKYIQNLLKNKQLLYLELHNTKDGIETFGLGGDYDFYFLYNVHNKIDTKVKFQDGIISQVNLSKLECIPSGMFKEFEKLLAKAGEERVNILNNSSYHTQREFMSKEKVGEFKYPCVYTTKKDGGTNFWYSNINNKGHFMIPKIIWSNGYSSTTIVDKDGTYGLTNFAYAIVDDQKNLSYIQKALNDPSFLKIMRPIDDGYTNKYNSKLISLFRKDFWKEFI